MNVSITTRAAADGRRRAVRRAARLARAPRPPRQTRNDHEQPRDAVAARQIAHRVRTLPGCFDEEQEVIACAIVAAEPGNHPAQALDHRMRGEERHDHTDRLGARWRASARSR